MLNWFRKAQTAEQPNSIRLDTRILLIVPSYDFWTRALTDHINDAMRARAFVCDRLMGPNASTALFTKWMVERPGRALIVFAGHGTATTLLTTPDLGMALDGDDAHGVLCDSSAFKGEHSVSVFAFCCAAASSLGRHIVASEGARFLGFDDELPYYLGTQKRSRSQAAPFLAGLDSVIQSEQVGRSALTAIELSYQNEITRWRSTRDDEDDKAVLIAGFLEWQLALLKLR